MILMDRMIAYCGLDCARCEAHIATVRNDDGIRRKVAEEWSKLNNVEITPDMINCDGCRTNGRKTPFCESLCPIRMCILEKGHQHCGRCNGFESCQKLGMITGNNTEALERLRSDRS